MSLFSFGGDKKTTNITENKTDIFNADNRVAADGGGIALGQGSSLDQSIDFRDQSDNSVRITDQSNRSTNLNDSRDQRDQSDNSVRITDQSNRSTNLNDSRDQRDQRVYNISNSDAEVALGAVATSRALGDGALALVNRGIEAQLASQKEARLLAENSLGVVADTTRANLKDTLSLLGDANTRSLDLAGKTAVDVLAFARDIAQRGQDESAASRVGAADTIKTVLASKEGADTKVSQDLIRYGAIALSLLAAVFILFRSKKTA